MKIIVFPNELTIGGSAINAIDLASAIGDIGHEAIVYALPGPLQDYIATKGLRFVPARSFRYRPAPNRIAELAALVRKEKADLVHAYEWPSCLDAFFGAGLLFGVPIVCTVLSMSVPPIIPRMLPLIMGTEELAEAAQATHRGAVVVMEPPIDTERDSPKNDGTNFRAAQGITRGEFLVVTVSRLSITLKLDALVDAINAVDQLAASWPVRLVIVGDGQAARQLHARATAVNQHHNREVVTLTGALLDPRPAYAAADIVVGMGSSALRALAHGKPVIVQGEQGFNAPFDEYHEQMFFRQGFYGIGDNTPGGPRLAEHLAALLAEPTKRAILGARGREIVVRRYSLCSAVARLLCLYEDAIAGRMPRRALLLDAARSAWLAAGIEVRNHLPSNKRILAELEQRKLTAISSNYNEPNH
ncbi:MAG: glycosyltransferase [Halobacteriota archaeon]